VVDGATGAEIRDLARTRPAGSMDTAGDGILGAHVSRSRRRARARTRPPLERRRHHAQADGGSIVGVNVFSAVGHGRARRTWGDENAPFRFSTGRHPHDPSLTDVIVTGNVFLQIGPPRLSAGLLHRHNVVMFVSTRGLPRVYCSERDDAEVHDTRCQSIQGLKGPGCRFVNRNDWNRNGRSLNSTR
jgi:hypothetical protein